ncbi:MAG: phospholipase A [Deltaproteobacteria bacterium]|nr:phospholipase A [Deltaproteobacteria bacterium]
MRGMRFGAVVMLIFWEVLFCSVAISQEVDSVVRPSSLREGKRIFAKEEKHFAERVLEDLSESEGGSNEHVFLAVHERNFVLPLSYNTTPNESVSSVDNPDRLEIKFQFSAKVRLPEEAVSLVSEQLNRHIGIWFAYTNTSFWQAYNGDESSPFRETNHSPELFIDSLRKFEFFGVTNSLLRVGAVHQSNGKGGELSRSWNRVYAVAELAKDGLKFGIKPWYRIPETHDEGGSERDDNPDIHKYVGYGEMYLSYSYRCQEFSTMFRNNLRSENRSGIRVEYSPYSCSSMSPYFEYFYGYGESLIDHDQTMNRISLGFSF